MSALEKANKALLEGKAARFAGLTAKEAESIRSLMLLTLKPVIYAANVADSDLATGNDMSRKLFAYAESHGSKAVLVSAQVESELSGLDGSERDEFLSALGVSDEDCGLKVSHTFFCRVATCCAAHDFAHATVTTATN